MARSRRERAVTLLDGMQSFGLVVLLAGLPFSEAMKSMGLAIAVTGFLGKLVSGARPSFPARGASWALLAFVAAGALSVAAAAPGLRRPGALFSLGMTVMPFYLVLDACARPSRKLFFALVVVAGGALASVLGYLDHMTGIHHRAVLGSVENAIPAAEYLAGVVPLAVALTLEEIAAPLAGPLLGLASGLAGLMFLMTKSRGPLPAAITGLSAAVGMSLRRWRWGIATFVACSVAFVVFVVANPGSRAADTMEGGGRSIASRLDAWKTTAGLIAERPLVGHGLGSYKDLDVVYTDEHVSIHLYNAHSVPLHVACESGVLGAGSLGVFLVLGLLGALKRARGSKGLNRAVSLGALGGAVAVLLAGAFSVSTDAEPGMLLFALLALGNVSGAAEERDIDVEVRS